MAPRIGSQQLVSLGCLAGSSLSRSSYLGSCVWLTVAGGRSAGGVGVAIGARMASSHRRIEIYIVIWILIVEESMPRAYAPLVSYSNQGERSFRFFRLLSVYLKS